MISNRGRAPAEIISLTDRIAIVGGQECLPHSPEYSEESLKKTTSPLILVPGEFAVIQTFAQNDLDWICKTEESRRRIEIASDQIYLHGRVTYRNLTSQNGDKPYVTDWCCKYIRDRSNSRLAVTGPPEYIKHS